ncbi:MFS transporter [Paraburkholderia sp. BCC1886]|uniref:MFS transporter n=1 Tax=Paraburkholderia sp. BCC1886 TaxID=2562670 RepID=UPI001183958C|nr:MFS transporter [Paraburkholderia sp. BCC1886]
MKTTFAADLPGVQAQSSTAATYGKITRRLMPILLLCYLVAYLDRINIGFAQNAMSQDLGFSAAVYGFGSGILFIGYLLFEVPSNYVLERIGARKTLARITFLWGIISMGMMFVRTPMQFYVMRFLLGVAEAGFFPGVILYLTYWYPPERRAKIVAVFMTPIAFSGFVGGPLSGWIMQNMGGVNGWKSWQWMFLIEGLPSIVMALLVMLFLVDRPDAASWLTPEEKIQVNRAAGSTTVETHGFRTTFAALIRDTRIYPMLLVYFALICGVVTTSSWIPALLKVVFPAGKPFELGLLTAIPYALGGVGMIWIGRRSDRTGERRWHCTLSLLGGALGMALLAWSSNLALTVVAMSVASIGIFAGFPTFWAASTNALDKQTSASGIALISSVGLIGGFVSPILIGNVRTLTGSYAGGLYAVAAVLALGAYAIFTVLKREHVSED